jgi:Ras-related protein Rab-23
MLEQDVDTTVKVIVVGNGQVGKTSMITRFAKGIFTNEYKKTIGVDFLEKKMHLQSIGEEITFLLWDTAGQEEYDAITRTYYKGAGACILAFSTTDRDSFDAVESWYQKVRNECGPICMALVQNKVDLMDTAQMDHREVEFTAKKLGLKLYRMCVKDDLNVSDVFTHLGTEFVRTGGSGAAGITPIEDVATRPIADRSLKGANAGGTAGEGAADGTPAASNGAQAGGPTIKLAPSVQRTGGKKSRFGKCAVQ